MKILNSFLVIIILFGTNIIKAQKYDDSSFMIMSSHGYMKTGLMTRGSGHVNTFLYSPSKLWAYGADLSLSQGNSIEIGANIFTLSLSPSIYSFPLNSNRHQIYLGASIGVGYTYISNRKGDGYHSYSYHNGSTMGFTFGTNAGYNYKFKENWMIGARIYSNYNLYSATSDDNLHSSVMGLISLGFRF